MHPSDLYMDVDIQFKKKIVLKDNYGWVVGASNQAVPKEWLPGIKSLRHCQDPHTKSFVPKKQNTGLPTSLSILSRNITPGIIRLPGSPSICLRNYPATVSVMTTQMWQKFHQVINSLINAKVDTPAGHSWRRCSRFLCSFFAPLIIALISCVFIIGSSAPFLIREITLKNCT